MFTQFVIAVILTVANQTEIEYIVKNVWDSVAKNDRKPYAYVRALHQNFVEKIWKGLQLVNPSLSDLSSSIPQTKVR